MSKRNGVGGEGSDIDIAFLTIKEVAEALKISVQSVRRLQQGRHLPFFKIGGSIRFSKVDLVAYLRGSKIEAMH